ncbi:hypothetical protein [Microseira sp. BLCC-F43]|jgi:DNA polymerase III delta prime subunit|uniref:hypothetical protein n=1 Tax=Microseira sp. BLCC-F43 TaxID=3153602 RepID=UPI0035B6F30A
MSILQFFPDSGDPTDTTGIAEKATFEPYFDAIAGQSTAIKLLERAISTNNLPNAYLSAGIDGVGKRMTARSFIKVLFCHSLPTEKADNCLSQAANYTDKGSLIGIQGELKLDEWIDLTTGQQRVKPVIRVSHLELLGSNPNSHSNSDHQAEQTANTAQNDF